MGPKKTQKADLQNKKSFFFEIGLAASLFIMIGIFACSQDEKTVEEIDMGIAPVDIELIDITRPEEERQVETRTITVHADVLNVVDNDRRINEEFNDWTEFEANLIIEPIRRTEEVIVDNDIFIKVEIMPKFRGGELVDFQRWVQSEVKYPSIAAENRVEGTVYVEFVVEKDGSVSGINVLQSPDSSLSEEVARVLRNSPQWEAGRQGRHPARVKFVLPVQFRLR